MAFVPGVAANPTGKNGTQKRRWKSALERALAREGGDSGIDGGLNRIADAVVAAAIAGDKDAWREIGDRCDGKVPQAVQHQGEDGGPVEHAVRVLFGRDAS